MTISSWTQRTGKPIIVTYSLCLLTAYMFFLVSSPGSFTSHTVRGCSFVNAKRNCRLARHVYTVNVTIVNRGSDFMTKAQVCFYTRN